MTPTQAFAHEFYRGDSPAMLKAFEDIRQSGIRRAREFHFERAKLVEKFKADPGSFWGYINLFRVTPLYSTDEAIEFWSFEAENQRDLRALKSYRYDPGKLRMAAERVVMARFFRRYGARIWQRRAA